MVLTEYGILLVDLHPNSVLLLAIFQHLCETFVDIQPLIALFRHFFYPCIEARMLAGSVAFWLHDCLSNQFIHVDKKRNEEWRHKWCFVCFTEADDSLAEPTGLVKHKASWSDIGERYEEFGPALAWI
jgi:hypothetical protein